MTLPTVVKIGGSLAESDAARALVGAIATLPANPRIIVPGGGDFADAVRATQRRHAFDEQTAHHMALLAMHLSALLFATFAPGLVVGEREADFASAWQRGLTPIWAPAPLVLAAPEVPASWDVTSDSLAAWLAGRLRAARLLVVKSCVVPTAMCRDARALAAAGIVDARFPDYVAAADVPWVVVSGAERALRALAD